MNCWISFGYHFIDWQTDRNKLIIECQSNQLIVVDIGKTLENSIAFDCVRLRSIAFQLCSIAFD